MNVSVVVNDTLVGYAWSAADVVPGMNDITVCARWDSSVVGREWISQFLSGYNTSLTIKTHEASIPGLPNIGLNLTIPAPHATEVFGKFIREATMHILSSTTSFVLASPIALAIDDISASAFHNGTKIAQIDYDLPFDVPRGKAETPKMPVEWELDQLGTVREALGGNLKLDARAEVGVRIGRWSERVWYEGRGIGARVRL